MSAAVDFITAGGPWACAALLYVLSQRVRDLSNDLRGLSRRVDQHGHRLTKLEGSENVALS